MMIVTLTILGTLILIGIVYVLITGKLKRQVWEGQLVDKQEEISTAGEYDSTYYALYVATADGNRRKSIVPKKLYNQLNVGDQLIKVKGETYPKKA